MPIVITPQGEYINSETGNPVNLPPQRPDIPRGMGVTGNGMEMARENIPANMDMGMDSMMPQTMGQQTGAALTPEEMQVGLANRSGSALTEGEMDDVAKVQMLVDMGLSPTDAMEAVAREKQMNPNPINPEAFSGGAVAPSTVENPAGMIAQGDPAMGAPSPMPRGATDMGMPENGVVADLMRRGYSSDMISAMIGGNMPPREDDAMNLERTGPPTITPTR